MEGVKFLDLELANKVIKKELISAVRQVIGRNDFILGEDVRLFEKEFARLCSTRYAVGVSSGTDALFLSLKSLGINPQDEVILPAFTYIATALAVSYTGAKPVFVDIDEKTFNIDADAMRKAITKNTKAIIPVHLFGQPADMRVIMEIAREFRLKVVEDACQAHGAKIKMDGKIFKPAGCIGDTGAFSFYPTKNLGGMGDGGIITTNEKEVYEKLLLLRDYGRSSRYEHVLIGFNSRLDTIQAAILRVKLQKLELWNNMRQSAALVYKEYLQGVDNIITPFIRPDVKHVFHAFSIRTGRRDILAEYLKKKNIGSMIYYPIPLHLQQAYLGLGYKQGDFPIAERISREIISLPIYPYLSKAKIKLVCDTIKRALK